MLDMQSNKVRVIKESLRPLLNKINTSMFNGNPLHCNCELRWYRDWFNRLGGSEHGLYTRCVTPSPEYIVNMPDSSFACIAPHIAYVTPNKEVDEGDDVFLTCSAVGDPAPVVKWTSSTGDSISIAPLHDRTRNKTLAMWHVPSISRSRAGLYRCNATNVKGSEVASMCVGVFIPGSNRTICDDIVSSTTTSNSPSTSPSTSLSTSPSTSPLATPPAPKGATTIANLVATFFVVLVFGIVFAVEVVIRKRRFRLLSHNIHSSSFALFKSPHVLRAWQ